MNVAQISIPDRIKFCSKDVAFDTFDTLLNTLIATQIGLMIFTKSQFERPFVRGILWGKSIGDRRFHSQKVNNAEHYNDVTMGAMASHITSLTIVYSTVYSGAD